LSYRITVTLETMCMFCGEAYGDHIRDPKVPGRARCLIAGRFFAPGRYVARRHATPKPPPALTTAVEVKALEIRESRIAQALAETRANVIALLERKG
jgi:hypothetical protein